MPLQLLAEAERDQDARGVGRELNAGADLLQPLRLIEARRREIRAARCAKAAVSPPMPAPAMMTVAMISISGQ